MNRIEKINKLENIKQKYILLKNYVIYCQTNLPDLYKEKENKKENEYVKKLVLTKPFYGKQLKVE